MNCTALNTFLSARPPAPACVRACASDGGLPTLDEAHMAVTNPIGIEGDPFRRSRSSSQGSVDDLALSLHNNLELDLELEAPTLGAQRTEHASLKANFPRASRHRATLYHLGFVRASRARL